MLLIEGSDNLGKTMLAKKIVRKIAEMGLPVVYGWMTRPDENVFDFFLDYKKLLNPYAVQDRFHLSGLAYHENKIPPRNLQMINGWIHGEGGLIVVMYASDETWYEEHIRKDTRKNILSWPALCTANSFYKQYAENSYNKYDYRFDVLPFQADQPRKHPVYVNERQINGLICEWLKKRKALGV